MPTISTHLTKKYKTPPNLRSQSAPERDTQIVLQHGGRRRVEGVINVTLFVPALLDLLANITAESFSKLHAELVEGVVPQMKPCTAVLCSYKASSCGASTSGCEDGLWGRFVVCVLLYRLQARVDWVVLVKALSRAVGTW